jgi:hypothetical protein
MPRHKQEPETNGLAPAVTGLSGTGTYTEWGDQSRANMFFFLRHCLGPSCLN